VAVGVECGKSYRPGFVFSDEGVFAHHTGAESLSDFGNGCPGVDLLWAGGPRSGRSNGIFVPIAEARRILRG